MHKLDWCRSALLTVTHVMAPKSTFCRAPVSGNRETHQSSIEKKFKTKPHNQLFNRGRRTGAVVDVVRQGPSVEISVPCAPSGIRAIHPRRRGRKSLQLSVVGA